MDAFAVVGFVAFVVEVVLGAFRGIAELIERCVDIGDQRGWRSNSETSQDQSHQSQRRRKSSSSMERRTDRTFGTDWDHESL